MSDPDLENAFRTLAADVTGISKPLPAAGLLWQRAAARARWHQLERATQSIRVAEWTASIVCAVTGMLALLGLGPDIEAVLRALDPTLMRIAEVALAATAGVTLILLRMVWKEEFPNRSNS